MDSAETLIAHYARHYQKRQEAELSLAQYLEACKDDPLHYASAAERIVAAIGEPTVVDTAQDERLGRIFMNRTIKLYPAFEDFYGMEETIERIVGFFRYAAQGLEERKQILYLLGPVGGGKSSLAERLKSLMEKHPIYVLKVGDELSPVFESPLGLFDPVTMGPLLEERFGIPTRRLTGLISPWAVKRLDELGGDISRFSVVRLYPSKLRQIAVSKTEPGDENNQDISSLVGKVDIRKLELYSQNDTDAYSYSGGLNRANQGILEFVEMFKAPIKMLHPLLTATQESNYVGTENIGAIPYQGIIMAHCFSEDTEILTVGGWKRREAVEVDDLIATLNRETGKIEYQPALKKYEMYYEGPMYHLSSSAADHLVTPNHKIIYESYGSYKETLAEDFFVKGAHLPVSGVLERPDLDYYASDDELRFHIWCVTEGSVHYIANDGRLNYRFHFNKDRKIKAFQELLSRLDFSWQQGEESPDGTTAFYVKRVPAKFTKQLTEIHRLLSARQATILLQEWGITDGSQGQNSRENHYQLSTNVPFHRDLLQELAALSGNKTTCAISRKEGYADVFMLNTRLGVNQVRSDNVNKGMVDYAGMVWCLETPNHTLIARRNGKVLITGNSNESEWQTFKHNKNNEAFIDRISVIKVPYCLRVSEEELIYKKLVSTSELAQAPCAPSTLEILARFSVLTRLKEHENSSLYSKMRIYNGESLKDTDPRAKSLQEYKDVAGVDEGMDGISTRFAFKVLSETFNYDTREVAADPVHLLYMLEQALRREQFPEETERRYLEIIKADLAPRYADFIGNEIQKAYLESYHDFGQNLFERYVAYADAWIEDHDFKDPDTGQLLDRQALNQELTKTEKPAGIANPKDFRNEVVKFALRARASKGGQMPQWTAYEKIREVIEKRMFAHVEDLLPVISFGAKADSDMERKHHEFVERMVTRGYTERQVRRLVEWYMRVKQAG